jgi:2-aminobenzoate-CoA ligase
MTSAHLDLFVRDRLPPPDLQPQFLFDLPELAYPQRLNAFELLDLAATSNPAGLAVIHGDQRWTYRRLQAEAGRIAAFLIDDLKLVPGQRVMLHAPNSPWCMAVWWGILKAGGIVVTTMPMLRAGELAKIIAVAEISHAFCDLTLADVVVIAQELSGVIMSITTIGMGADLDRRLGDRLPLAKSLDTAADDVALLAFTSGTTGKPKACIHFHRDILSMARTFSRHILNPQPNEIFCGTPPFSFTFGLGALVVFPAAAGVCVVLPAAPGYDGLCEAIRREKVTTLFTAPTGYRALLKSLQQYDLTSLKKCVSAGEHLPRATSDQWFEATGIRLIDGIGSTEMIHIFISAAGNDIRPGATGKAVPGFTACILDEDNHPMPGAGKGRLAVRGPTGCRYLNDERQLKYVVNGWNVTGDIYERDEDGYFSFISRSDDIIVSSGYNIAAGEVEQALLLHPKVQEVAVVGSPDPERGAIVKAYVVLRDDASPSAELAGAMQDFVKQNIAPYKYPRAIEFVADLPKTPTGKLQRFRLRDPLSNQ